MALLFLLVDSLETLAEIASVLQLYSYAALNIGVIVLRVANPDWYEPTYRVPAMPYVQVFAALGCIAIILLSGLVAQAIILGLIVISLTWYAAYAKSRVDIQYGLVAFRAKWAEVGWSILFQPAVIYKPAVQSVVIPAVRMIEVTRPRRVIVALANPKYESILLPWGGGLHAQLGLEFALRIGQVTGATIHLLRIVGMNTAVSAATESLISYHEKLFSSLSEWLFYFERTDFLIIRLSGETAVFPFYFSNIPQKILTKFPLLCSI